MVRKSNTTYTMTFTAEEYLKLCDLVNLATDEVLKVAFGKAEHAPFSGATVEELSDFAQEFLETEDENEYEDIPYEAKMNAYEEMSMEDDEEQ